MSQYRNELKNCIKREEELRVFLDRPRCYISPESKKVMDKQVKEANSELLKVRSKICDITEKLGSLD
jgi:hypothetical protein